MLCFVVLLRAESHDPSLLTQHTASELARHHAPSGFGAGRRFPNSVKAAAYAGRIAATSVSTSHSGRQTSARQIVCGTSVGKPFSA